MDDYRSLVHGEGEYPNEWMLIAEGPGWREQRDGRPLVGPTGEECNRLLSSIGAPRSSWYLSNLYRMMPPGKGIPYTPEDLAISEPFLHAELTKVQPRLIVTMGRLSTRYFLGDVGIEEVWGLHLRPPVETFEKLPMLRPDVTVVPLVHIAAGFHNAESSSLVVAGFEELKRILRGDVEARELYSDTYPNPVYLHIEDADDLVAWWGQPGGSLRIGCDTEGYKDSPWSIQLSRRPGEAILVRSTDRELIAILAALLAADKPRLIFHNGLHDIAVMRAMGIDVIALGIPFDDTMLRAYLLGIEPQGLKPLCTRHHGMKMQSYDEVLGDAQNRRMRTYLQWLWDDINDKYQRRCKEDFDFQIRVAGRRIKKVPKLPKTQLHKAVERVLGSKDPWRLWNDQVLDLQVAAHQKLGPAPRASLSDVRPEIALHYAGRDADGTVRVEETLRPRIHDMGLDKVYALDLSTYPMLDRMMQIGLKPDPVAFRKLAGKLDEELDVLRARLCEATCDSGFNANSGDQVAEYLYNELGLEPLGRSTESGRGSTNDKVLEALMHANPGLPVIADIRSYREYYKLRWTFVERLPELTKRWPGDGRIHCELKLTRTPSGRLAAADPNLLAMPKHGKFAKDFRRCFVAEEGHVLLSNDISQAELRTLAHLSQDPIMLAIYRGQMRNPDGSLIDLHAKLAERIFGVKPKDQDESKHRLPAKAINFGLPMGMQAQGLTLELRKSGLDVSEDDAQRWIDETDALYVSVPAYKKAKIEEATRNGYVRCLSGRIRYIGGIRSRNEAVRSEAERFAFSTPIQEGAQWIGKTAIDKIWREVFVPLHGQGYCEPVLWIHDDLLSEMDEKLLMEVAPKIVAIMSTPPPGFSVPIKTDPKAGRNWADMGKVPLA